MFSFDYQCGLVSFPRLRCEETNTLEFYCVFVFLFLILCLFLIKILEYFFLEEFTFADYLLLYSRPECLKLAMYLVIINNNL